MEANSNSVLPLALFCCLVSQQAALADDPPLKKITVTVADEPLEIYEGSVFPAPLRFKNEKDFKDQFVASIANYLTTEHASN